MDDPFGVGGFERVADLRHGFGAFCKGEAAFLFDEGAEIFALNKLHGDEFDSVGIT